VNALELVVDAGNEIGESPIWDQARQRLLWVDIPAGTVNSFEGGAHQSSTPIGQSLGFLAPNREGGFVVGVRDGIGILDANLRFELVAPLELGTPETRMNDGKCGPDGRLWAGTIVLTADRPVGSLYRVSKEFKIDRVLQSLTCSNGMAWNNRGDLMYFTDSPTGRIDVLDYDVDTGQATNRRPFVRVEGTPGTPDGMTIDVDDALWVAVAGGACVRRYLADGRLDMEIAVPAPFTASCAFGGANYDELYVTTGRAMQSPESLAAYPHSGAVFVCRPGPVGSPAAAFGM
jgi:sugar lactone lactonase YvrE